ncbi:MAG: (Fe-S)-binding protein [Bacteroides sp.]|nr:(Fe-S)-binding protein [Bacteroides sp.]
MKQLIDFKEEIHKCSKCGLCQGECPIYKITGNDCSVSRGQFVMLSGLIKGDLKMTKIINSYLDLCLKCGACSKFCPSGIDIVDIIVAAKAEYFKKHKFEKLVSFFQKNFVFKFAPNFVSLFRLRTKSKTFEKKVLYFGGCGSKIKGDKAVVKILNSLNVEVINPTFSCCGISLFMRGDLESFNNSITNYVNVLKKYDIKEVVTTCASCEKTLKDYARWCDSVEQREFLSTITVKNIYEYLKDEHLVLKKPVTVTFHKPCNINNYEDVENILVNTENLNYIKMNGFDKCCGLNAITKIKNYKITQKVFNQKINNINSAGAKYVLTSCLGCEVALKLYSFGRYKVYDLVEFISERV